MSTASRRTSSSAPPPALNGAFIASRPQTVATADALGSIWRALRRGQVFPVAVDVLSGEELRLSHGSLPDAVLASCAMYVLPTGHAGALEEPPRGALGMALHALSLLTDRRLADDIARHRADYELIVLPPPCPLSITPIGFERAGERSIERSRTLGRSATAAHTT